MDESRADHDDRRDDGAHGHDNAEVARLLTTRRISSMPVVDDDEQVVGVVNDEELFTRESWI